MVHKLLAYNPKERISAADALMHPWIKKNSNVQIDKVIAKNTLENLRNFSVSLTKIINELREPPN